MLSHASVEDRLGEAIRWLARGVGIGLAAVFISVGLGDVLNRSAPPVLTLVLWADIFVGLLLAFFWESLAGAVEALAALATQAAGITVIPGGSLNPINLLFVLAGLAFLYCGWRRHAHYRRGASSQGQHRSSNLIHEKEQEGIWQHTPMVTNSTRRSLRQRLLVRCSSISRC